MKRESPRPANQAGPAANSGERRADFTTVSGLTVQPVYAPTVAPELGRPGEFPFTRGIHPTMYRGRLWTMRQYAGFGTAQETNARYRYLLDHGQTGLSVAFDLPTQMGYDADHAMAAGEVGRAGVAISSLQDMRVLFDGIPLERVSVSMTINATAAILLALYIALADERGVPRAVLSGTIQNDILKEYVARGTYIYPVEPSLRLVTDIFAFAASQVPRWNTISISGYHMREAGATAPQEVAFTFAHALEYIGRAVQRGLAFEQFAPRLSFFFAAHSNFFEEIAKFRAARRLWAYLMRERYHASDESSRLRFHTQTGGVTLTAQQPLNNVVRVALQAMAAVLGGTQSLHTNGYDEALALPTQEAAKLALRTQQIIAEESGAADTVDPMGGSYFLESLTDTIETSARAYLRSVEELGGAAEAIGYIQDQIQRAAYQHQLQVESGERGIVGVNTYQEAEGPPRIEQPDYSALEQEQRRKLQVWKTERDASAVQQTLAAVRAAAASDSNLLPLLIDAVKARATLGEVSDALRSVWGVYRGVARAPNAALEHGSGATTR
jgi:methylmalonyl-CoA mutase N-terminal domain/subunit